MMIHVSSDLISFLFRMKEDTAGGSQAQLATSVMNDEELDDVGMNVRAGTGNSSSFRLLLQGRRHHQKSILL